MFLEPPVLCLRFVVVLFHLLAEMDATQAISDSILESDEEENKEENQNKRGRPLAKLCILKNSHLPETGKWSTTSFITHMIWQIVHSQLTEDVFSLPFRVAPLFGR